MTHIARTSTADTAAWAGTARPGPEPLPTRPAAVAGREAPAGHRVRRGGAA